MSSTMSVAKGDQKGFQWIDITDFSPGIFSNSNIVVGPNAIPGPFTAPMGAADGNNTFQCLPLANGGIGPGPALIQANSLAAFGETSFPASGTDAWVVGAINSFITSEDEIVIALEQLSPTHEYQLWSLIWGTNSANLIFTSPTLIGNSTVGGSPYPFSTRVAVTAPTTSVGQPVLVFPINSADAGGAHPGGFILLYPNPATPTTFSTYDLINGVSGGFAGPTFGHQTRIVALTVGTQQGWPVGGAGAASFNEAFQYTDPPNSETWPVQNEVFVAEQPYGYGAWGSVSAGELFLVKQRDGGVVISGDLNNPSVTWFPGIMPTGPIGGRADADHNGIYYCSAKQGSHLWNGSNASQKISTQLDDDFFLVEPPIPSELFSFFCQRWGDWMMFSNNWMFNSDSGSWWRLSNPNTGGFGSAFFWYVPGYDQDTMYCILSYVNNGTSEPLIYQYNRHIPTSTWTWQTLPIRLSENRTFDVREVVVRASNPYLDNGPALALTLYDDSGAAHVLDPFVLDPSTPDIQMYRTPAGVKCTELVLSMAASGEQYGPVVHSVHVAYRTREQTVTI
jgi:hypothetical protein